MIYWLFDSKKKFDLIIFLYNSINYIGTGGRAPPQAVRVQGCTGARCDVFQGADAVMQVDFRAIAGATALRPVVFATALGATVEYNLPPHLQNACTQLGSSSCPLSPNEDATYHFRFSVTTFYPPIPVDVEISLINQAGATVFCTIVPIHVRVR